MINEKVLLEQIQKPFDLGVTTRKRLQAKFQEVKQQIEAFLEESDSSIEACQHIGERAGRFIGWGLGLVCSYVIIPGVALCAILVMRASQRAQARWGKMQQWVNEPSSPEAVPDAPVIMDINLSSKQAPISEPTSGEEDMAGKMVALPPCDDEPSLTASMGRSLTFMQETAAGLPKTLTADGIKQAYQNAKRRTKQNPLLTGLVTAGFTAISFFAIQIDPAKESAIASSSTPAPIEEVSVSDFEPIDLDDNDMN